MSKKKASIGKGKERTTASADAGIPRELAIVAGTAFAALALLRFVAAQFPGARLWGLNAAAWLPTWVQLLLLAAGMLVATPPFIRNARRIFELAKPFSPVLSIAAPAVIAGAAFWFVRMETYFLGDGAVYLAEHFRYLRGLPVAESVLYSSGSAPLTGWLLAQGARLFFTEGAPLAGNPQFIFWLAGAAAGVLFVVLAAVYSQRHSARADERVATAFLLIFTPATLFFFGYVEYYTLALVGIAATAALSIEAAQRRIAPVWPLLALVCSAALHLMSLVLLPGVLLAALAAKESGERFVTLRGVLLLSAAALAAGGVYYFASGIAFEGSRIILSLVPFGAEGAIQHYTLLSGAHLVDVVNMLLLTAAPTLLALPFLRRRGWDAPSLVGLTHVIFSFFLMFFGYSGFGMARDWDVTAFFAVVFALFLLVLLRREEEPRRSHLLHLAAWGSLVAVLPWLAVNIDATASEQRFRDVMALDDRTIPGDFALNGYEHLRKYSQSTGDREGVVWAIGKKIEMVGYPDDFRKYALALIEGAPAAERATRWQWMMENVRGHLERMQKHGRDNSYAGSRAEFRELAIELLTQAGQLPQAAGEMDAVFEKEATALRGVLGNDPLLALAEAQRSWDRTGVFPGGDAYRAAAPAITLSGTLAFHAGRGLLTASDHDAAAEALDRALRYDSSFTLTAYYLAEAERQQNPPRVEQAIGHYSLFLSTPERHRIADAGAQQRLMDDARMKIAELELQRLGLP